MTSLADVALAFAKECLGWDAASAQYVGDNVIWNGKFNEYSTGFHFDDLNAVMEAVRGWCEANTLDCTLRYVCISKLFEARLVGEENGSMGRELAQILYTEPCHALLAACVEAARKLKTV